MADFSTSSPGVSIINIKDSSISASDMVAAGREQDAEPSPSPLGSTHSSNANNSKHASSCEPVADVVPDQNQDKKDNLKSSTKGSSDLKEMFKKAKTSIPLDRRVHLQLLHMKHGSTKSVAWYSTETGIHKFILSKFISFMEHGLDIRTMAYRPSRQPKANKYSPSIVPRKETFSVSYPIQLNAVEEKRTETPSSNHLQNPLPKRRDVSEISSVLTSEPKDKPAKEKNKLETAPGNNVVASKKINDAPVARQVYISKQSESDLLPAQHSGSVPPVAEEEDQSIPPFFLESSTEQLKENRSLHRSILMNRIRFSRIELCTQTRPKEINGASEKESASAQFEFLMRYRHAMTEGRVAIFISMHEYQLFVEEKQKPYSLFLLSLISSDGDIICELFLNEISKVVVRAWATTVLAKNFARRAALIIASQDFLGVLPSYHILVVYSDTLERFSPVRHIIEIWENRVKRYSLLEAQETLGELLNQLSTEFLTLPRTSLLRRLAEIREQEWPLVYHAVYPGWY